MTAPTQRNFFPARLRSTSRNTGRAFHRNIPGAAVGAMTNNLATFSPSAFGSPLFLFVEQPGEHALSGFLTGSKAG